MWHDIISSLLGSGMTQVQIAAAVGISQSMVSDLLNSKISEPGWSTGNALIKLQEERCGKD